jgi:hypothetical protein
MTMAAILLSGVYSALRSRRYARYNGSKSKIVSPGVAADAAHDRRAVRLDGGD